MKFKVLSGKSKQKQSTESQSKDWPLERHGGNESALRQAQGKKSLQRMKVTTLADRVRRAFDSFGGSKHHEGQFQKQAREQHPHKKRHNARHQRDESLRL